MFRVPFRPALQRSERDRAARRPKDSAQGRGDHDGKEDGVVDFVEPHHAKGAIQDACDKPDHEYSDEGDDQSVDRGPQTPS